jgi:Ca2+/Na+ antiporter
VKTSGSEDRERIVDAVKQKYIKSKLVSLSNVMASEMMQLQNETKDGLLADAEAAEDYDKRLRSLLRPFFRKYDRNGDLSIDSDELRLLLQDIGEAVDDTDFHRLMLEMDTNRDGSIDFDEFVVAMRLLVEGRVDGTMAIGDSGVSGAGSANRKSSGAATPGAAENGRAGGGGEDDDGDDSDGDEEIPEEFQHLSPKAQQRAILIRSCIMMAVGTVTVVLFSDPMVDILSELGKRTGIPAFYVSFVLAPLASNASELIAAYKYAQKKTKKTATIALSALEGAACLNNTFCLAIFLALVFFREETKSGVTIRLGWQYSAETISILFVQIVMFFIARLKTQKMLHAYIALSLFPISILLVIGLEAAGLD